MAESAENTRRTDNRITEANRLLFASRCNDMQDRRLRRKQDLCVGAELKRAICFVFCSSTTQESCRKIYKTDPLKNHSPIKEKHNRIRKLVADGTAPFVSDSSSAVSIYLNAVYKPLHRHQLTNDFSHL